MTEDTSQHAEVKLKEKAQALEEDIQYSQRFISDFTCVRYIICYLQS